jgi:hypothetical protein
MTIMSDESIAMRQLLSECLEVAKRLGTELEYEITEAVEMEFEATNVQAHFVEECSSNASLNVRLLLDQLQERTVVAAIDLFPPPQARLVIHGAATNRNYRIIIQL